MCNCIHPIASQPISDPVQYLDETSSAQTPILRYYEYNNQNYNFDVGVFKV